MCGRRHASKFAFVRTAMLVEGHWSMLKRSLLQNYYRPRVDMLVFVIDRLFLTNITIEFNELIKGSKKPNCLYKNGRGVKERQRCINIAQTDTCGHAAVQRTEEALFVVRTSH